jgi:hypothetical protein
MPRVPHLSPPATAACLALVTLLAGGCPDPAPTDDDAGPSTPADAGVVPPGEADAGPSSGADAGSVVVDAGETPVIDAGLAEDEAAFAALLEVYRGLLELETELNARELVAGPAGDAGPIGPQGPTGPQGPPGGSELTDLELAEVNATVARIHERLSASERWVTSLEGATHALHARALRAKATYDALDAEADAIEGNLP